MSEHRQNISGQVARLFSAFERGVQPERAARYIESLQRVPIDRLERAVSWVIDHWEEKSPPTIAKLRAIAWRGENAVEADGDAERQKLGLMCDVLATLHMADWYEFKRAFGCYPSAALYSRLGVPVPERVTFTPPDPAWCRQTLAAEMVKTRAAFHRLGAKHKVKLGPADLAAVAERDRRDLSEPTTEPPF